MSIFNQVPRSELGTRFTHLGWFAFCPIYISAPFDQEPVICERNGVPEFVLTAAEWLQASIIFVLSMMSPDYEPSFAFTLTGRISPS